MSFDFINPEKLRNDFNKWQRIYREGSLITKVLVSVFFVLVSVFSVLVVVYWLAGLYQQITGTPLAEGFAKYTGLSMGKLYSGEGALTQTPVSGPIGESAPDHDKPLLPPTDQAQAAAAAPVPKVPSAGQISAAKSRGSSLPAGSQTTNGGPPVNHRGDTKPTSAKPDTDRYTADQRHSPHGIVTCPELQEITNRYNLKDEHQLRELIDMLETPATDIPSSQRNLAAIAQVRDRFNRAGSLLEISALLPQAVCGSGRR